MPTDLRRGCVVRVRLDPAEGREIRKTRPAVVVSNDAACRADSVVQIVPCTSLPDRPLRPWEARIDPGRSGLAKPSRAVANQLRTVSRGRLAKVLGRVTDDELADLERAIRVQLGLG